MAISHYKACFFFPTHFTYKSMVLFRFHGLEGTLLGFQIRVCHKYTKYVCLRRMHDCIILCLFCIFGHQLRFCEFPEIMFFYPQFSVLQKFVKSSEKCVCTTLKAESLIYLHQLLHTFALGCAVGCNMRRSGHYWLVFSLINTDVDSIPRRM